MEGTYEHDKTGVSIVSRRFGPIKVTTRIILDNVHGVNRPFLLSQ